MQLQWLGKIPGGPKFRTPCGRFAIYNPSGALIGGCVFYTAFDYHTGETFRGSRQGCKDWCAAQAAK